MVNIYTFLIFFIFSLISCEKSNSETQIIPPVDNNTDDNQDKEDDTNEYDETGCLYTSYEGLVMSGYQGWFNCEGDGANRGWNHLGAEGKFEPGYSSIDFWPDMSEYEEKYETAFKFENGGTAYMYSPYNYSTIDLHFKWMKEYGIDGVFFQRFLTITKNGISLNHSNQVFKNILKAGEKYQRAVCLMYDLSGSTAADFTTLVHDFSTLVKQNNIFDNNENHTYLRHKGKPLLALWGVGFNDDKRKYTIEEVYNLVKQLKEINNVSIMLGVPYYWRTLTKDTKMTRYFMN